MSVKTKTALGTDVDTVLASGTNITAAEHRGIEHDIIDSYEDFIGSYTTAQIASIASPVLRQIVFDTDRAEYRYYDGTRFVSFAHPKYEVWHGLLLQSSTNPPTDIVLDNTIGGTIIWTYDSVGGYIGTLAGVFTQYKTAFIISNSSGSGIMSAAWLDANSFIVNTYNQDGATKSIIATDGLLQNNFFGIHIFY